MPDPDDVAKWAPALAALPPWGILFWITRQFMLGRIISEQTHKNVIEVWKGRHADAVRGQELAEARADDWKDIALGNDRQAQRLTERLVTALPVPGAAEGADGT